MKMRTRDSFLFLIFAALAMSAAATTLKHMSVAEMSRAARVIVRARCMANSTDWDDGEIWTFTSFEVEDVWRGSAAAHIMVRLLGGKYGDVTSSVSAIPRFRPGEEVILFLESTPRGDFSIVSWAQGTFRIRHDRQTGKEIITQDTAGFSTFDPATRRFEASGIWNLPLEDLRAQVDAAQRDEGGRNP